jgi:hypothetical protein
MSYGERYFISPLGKLLAYDAVHRAIAIPILSDIISISALLKGIRQADKR